MSDFVTAFGLLLVLEGLSYAAFPGAMKRAISQALDISDGNLSRFGLLAAAIGLGLIYLVRG